MPRGASAAPRSMSSWNGELPPSMTMSPSASSGTSASITSCVGVAVGQHQPDDPRLREPFDHLGKLAHWLHSIVAQFLAFA